MVYEVKANLRGLTFNFNDSISVNAHNKDEAHDTAKRRLAKDNNVAFDSVFITDIKEG